MSPPNKRWGHIGFGADPVGMPVRVGCFPGHLSSELVGGF